MCGDQGRTKELLNPQIFLSTKVNEEDIKMYDQENKKKYEWIENKKKDIPKQTRTEEF
jgi:hypothetical protein